MNSKRESFVNELNDLISYLINIGVDEWWWWRLWCYGCGGYGGCLVKRWYDGMMVVVMVVVVVVVDG